MELSSTSNNQERSPFTLLFFAVSLRSLRGGTDIATLIRIDNNKEIRDEYLYEQEIACMAAEQSSGTDDLSLADDIALNSQGSKRGCRALYPTFFAGPANGNAGAGTGFIRFYLPTDQSADWRDTHGSCTFVRSNR